MKKDKKTPTPPSGSSSEKITPGTKNLVEDAKEKLLSLFPECATEARDAEGGKKTIDLEKLRELLAPDALDDNGPAVERYEFTWPGKRDAVKEAFRPVAKTLRPDRASSLDFDSTANLYIEGDNLDALKILQNTYLGKVKMIYIDPPYNTGGDFVYNDNFRKSRDALDVADADGLVAFAQNTKENPHYHSDWCSMIYPRLKLARNLLCDDGVIFISIDDNEVHNLRKICDEIFGEGNKVAEFVVIRAEGGGMAKQVIKGHDYLLVYAKNITLFTPLGRPKDVRGKTIERCGEWFWIQEDWIRKEFGKYGNCHYEEILEYKGREKLDEINAGLNSGKYILIPKPNGMNVVGKLRNLKQDSSKFYSVLKHLSADGFKDLQVLALDEYFSYPKPISLVQELVSGATLFTAKDENIVLDFFSGSATTAHAVMQLNAEDGGNRRFIMVQLPEPCKKGSEAADSGFKNICEIGKERIRRAGTKIKADLQAEIERRQTSVEKLKAQLDALREKQAEVALVPDATLAEKIASAENELETAESALEQKRATLKNLDTGFRVFKVDETPEKDVFATAGETRQAEGQGIYQQNFKYLVTEEDLLFFALLQKTKIAPDDKIELRTLCGNRRVYFVAGTALIACFDADGNVDNELMRAIAGYQPAIAVFRDAGFKDDPPKINAEQIFKQLSPDTKILVL